MLFTSYLIIDSVRLVFQAINEIKALSSAMQNCAETKSKLAKCHNNASNSYKTLKQYDRAEVRCDRYYQYNKYVQK